MARDRDDVTQAASSDSTRDPSVGTRVIATQPSGKAPSADEPPPLPEDSQPELTVMSPDAMHPTIVQHQNRRVTNRGGTLIKHLGNSRVPRPVQLREVAGARSLADGPKTLVGRYIVGPTLGTGGMGVVRLVRDQDIGRNVAMKTLNPGDPDIAALERPLISEAQTTGQLEHPNIMPVYELGVLPAGDVFYTMKAMSGFSLKDVLKGLRLGDAKLRKEYTERRLLSIFTQICQALHYAHSRGVVHRDLKPDNVLLGSYGEVLVMDWGIAYVIGTTDDPLAQPGMVVGTPHYMAPEQARGEISRIDGRTDVYSLGVILYEMLTLTTPIAEILSAQEIPADLDAHADMALDAVRRMREARRPIDNGRNGRVPDVLADIVTTATAPSPKVRYATARQLIDRIEEYLEGSAERDRRTLMASAELAVGVQAIDRYRRLRESRSRLGEDVARRSRTIHRWDPMSAKRELSDITTRHSHMELQVSQAFSAAVNHFHRVLGLVPDHPQAKAALANLYWQRFREAEAIMNFSDMIYFADLVLKFNDPARGPVRAGDGQVTVRSFPEGAEIVIYDASRGLPESPAVGGRKLGAAPVSSLELPAGLYLLVARKEGYREAQMPVFVRPGEHRTYLLSLHAWTTGEPVVGREGELGLLRDNFARAVEGRQVRRILLSGADGSGKSRTLDEFNRWLEQAESVVVFFFSDCAEAHALVPYAPISEALRIRAGILPSDSAAAARRKLIQMITASVEVGGEADTETHQRISKTAECLVRLPGMCAEYIMADRPPREMRQMLDEALLEFITLCTARDAAFILFQEVEHLDDATSRLFSIAHRYLEDTGLLVLGLSGSAVGSFWDEQIHLRPLGETPIHALLRNLLKAPMPATLHAHVMARSGGIPWLAVDTVRRLVEDGDLHLADGRWFLNSSVARPEQTNMFEARQAQLDELPMDLADALRAAAVMGNTFWLEALESVGIADPESVCAELVSREFFRELPYSRYPETRAFAFRSALFREIVYDSIIDADETSRLHKHVSQWMRQRYMGDIREVAELARHAELAHDEDWAARLYLQLGDVCRDCGCAGMARECYTRALTNAVNDDDRTVLETRLQSVRGGASR
ncbi:MAG: protein kinase [Myxococcota bacterium]|nr:protein kinase [Myxococcota bacterium]